MSHAAPLVDMLARAKDASRIELAKDDGATIVTNRKTLDTPSWQWTP